MPEDRELSIAAGGDVLGEATISTPDDAGEVRVAVNMASGQLPAGARQRVVETIHDAVTTDGAERVTATVPIGDSELVDGIRSHLDEPELRAAGATSIIRGDVRAT